MKARNLRMLAMVFLCFGLADAASGESGPGVVSLEMDASAPFFWAAFQLFGDWR